MGENYDTLGLVRRSMAGRANGGADWFSVAVWGSGGQGTDESSQDSHGAT